MLIYKAGYRKRRGIVYWDQREFSDVLKAAGVARSFDGDYADSLLEERDTESPSVRRLDPFANEYSRKVPEA